MNDKTNMHRTVSGRRISEAGKGQNKLEIENWLLRTALVGIVGASTRPELEMLEVMLRLAPAPEQDKAIMINGIHALLQTL